MNEKKVEKMIKSISENAGKKYSIIVKYRPPVKGNSTPENKIRKQKLKEEATKQLDYSNPKGDNVKMKIHYYNGEGGDDVLNVEGGIADALEGVAYNNDRQIRSSCIDEHFLRKEPTWYKIDLEFLGLGIRFHDSKSEK